MAFRTHLSSITRRIRHSSVRPQPRTLVRAFSEESIARYRPGGYHPVRIGDLFHHGKYKVISKLGYGLYSTVWLAFDSMSKHHVALKILTAESFGNGRDTFELDILNHMREDKTFDPRNHHVLPLLDSFAHHGPNGTHICLAFPAMGPDMSEYRRLFAKLRIPLPILRRISRQLLLALSYLHDNCRVVHTDIKPQNILIQTSAIREMFELAPSDAFRSDGLTLQPPRDFYMQSTQLSSGEEDLAQATDISVMLADFGTASWFDRHLMEWIQPEKLRAPEVILGAKWDHKVDVWNLGVIIWEFATGQLLFDGQWSAGDSYSEEAHLAQMTAVFGDVPTTLLHQSKNPDRHFDSHGHLRKSGNFPPCSLEQIAKNSDLLGSERRDFLHFIESMVKLDPEKRPDARALLASPWLS